MVHSLRSQGVEIPSDGGHDSSPDGVSEGSLHTE